MKILKTWFYRVLFPIFGALLSGVILVLSFPNYNQSWLAWVGLVPLFITASGRSATSSFLLWYLCGAVFFTGIIHWVAGVPGFTVIHYGILVPYLGSYFALVGLIFGLVNRRWGIIPALTVAPFAWISLEFARANFFFLALPWWLLAHSQYQSPAVIQISSFTGAYGISFLIVLINATLTAVILRLFSALQKPVSANIPIPSGRAVITMAVVTASLSCLVLLYGLTTLSRPVTGKPVKISVVQGNIAQEMKWDKKHAEFIMEIYTDLTREASKEHPTLIVWPETATPRSISRNPRLFRAVRKLTGETAVPVLLGSAEEAKFQKRKDKTKYRNAAFLIDSKARIQEMQQYYKVKLLPFGEYLPYEDRIPWSYLKTPVISGYVPGDKYTVFELPGYRFGVTICWENIFPGLVRRFVREGAQLIINITNEGYFGTTAAPYQVLSMAAFRAVENGVFLIRCANIGISCFIDPRGRIVDRVRGPFGEDLNIRGILTGSVIPMKSRTFYTRYGDWFVWLGVAISIIFIIVTLLRKSTG